MTTMERRQSILEALCVRRHEKAVNLAFEYGVNVSTIFRDVLSLSLEYPIYTIQGHDGGIFVEDGFYLHKSRFTDAELDVLEEALPYFSGKKREILLGIILKHGGEKRHGKKHQ